MAYRFYSRSSRKNHKEVRVTLAGLYNTTEGKLRLSAARCIRTDRFEKSIGRKLAEDRYVDHKWVAEVEGLEQPLGHKDFVSLAKYVASEIKKHPRKLHSTMRFRYNAIKNVLEEIVPNAIPLSAQKRETITA